MRGSGARWRQCPPIPLLPTQREPRGASSPRRHRRHSQSGTVPSSREAYKRYENPLRARIEPLLPEPIRGTAQHLHRRLHALRVPPESARRALADVCRSSSSRARRAVDRTAKSDPNRAGTRRPSRARGSAPDRAPDPQTGLSICGSSVTSDLMSPRWPAVSMACAAATYHEALPTKARASPSPRCAPLLKTRRASCTPPPRSFATRREPRRARRTGCPGRRSPEMRRGRCLPMREPQLSDNTRPPDRAGSRGRSGAPKWQLRFLRRLRAIPRRADARDGGHPPSASRRPLRARAPDERHTRALR